MFHPPQSLRTRRKPVPIVHRVVERINGADFERELVHPHHFIKNRFIDLTAIKEFLAPWIREEVKKALEHQGE